MNFGALRSWRSLREEEVKSHHAKFAMIAKDRRMNFAALRSQRSLREVEVKYYLAKFAMIAKD